MIKSETPVLPEMASLWQETLSWQPSATVQKQFQRLYELILEGNRQLNLTRITEPTDFWEKHLWDSLRGIAPLLKDDSSRKPDEINRFINSGSEATTDGTNAKPLQAIDIGTGAGFPGLPIAIASPNCLITLLDSTQKKIAFLNALISALGIQNATTLTGRAEEFGQKVLHRNNYDIALIRAVGSASSCAEYALPFLKNGGLAILYRGRWTDEEAEALKPVLEKLGGVVESIEEFITPISGSDRHCIYLRKIALTKAAFSRPISDRDR